jgi:hypothetical protein
VVVIVKSYDEKCAELARLFLRDELLATDENVHELALSIQQAIEDGIEDIKDRAPREPKRSGV